MRENQQYTCPECGVVGATWVDAKPPFCHRCEDRVVMQKSHNGKVIQTKENINQGETNES